jgi:endonuclease III
MDRVLEIIKRLKKNYPAARVALEYKKPHELLIATILSAQSTDKLVNLVTKKLFKKYRTVADFAKAGQREMERDVHSTGFYRNKARNVILASRMLLEKFGGKVPDTMESITELPGVARKTANIVLGNIYGVIAGIAVDTHVIRVSQKLGLTKNQDPVRIEQDLMKIIPKKDWFKFSYLIQALGRDVCRARRQDHMSCVLMDICPSAKHSAGK